MHGRNSRFVNMLKIGIGVGFLLALGCQNSPLVVIDPGLPPPTGTYIKSASVYYTSGDTIVLLSQGCACVKDTSVAVSSFKRYKFHQDGRKLVIDLPRSDSSSPSCTSGVQMTFDRLWGTSLVGGWAYSSESLVIAGTATASDSQKCDTFYQSLSNLVSCWLAIDTTQFAVNMLPDTGKFCAAFSKEWKDTLLKRYNASLQTFSSDSLNIFFNTTFDTVRISRSPARILTTSTTPGSCGKVEQRYTALHDPNPYKFSDDGSMCPSKKYPDWLIQGLLIINRKY